MGKVFDKLNDVGYESPINKYLKERGFYADTMHPRFMNGYGYDDLSIGKHCFRHDSSINDDCILRIFINDIDIYYEVQSSYGSYERSGRYDASDYLTAADIDGLLDEIMESVLD